MNIPVLYVLNTKPVNARLRKLAAANADLTPLMRSIAGFMHGRVEENFAQEGRPKWAPLSPVTVQRRGSANPILQHSGQLAASIEPSSDATSATVGTNKVYARVMQEGAKKGQFGKAARGFSIPWGDIPARPFMQLTPEDLGQGGVLGLVINYEKNAGGN